MHAVPPTSLLPCPRHHPPAGMQLGTEGRPTSLAWVGLHPSKMAGKVEREGGRAGRLPGIP